jgi:hypothetical protein
MGNPNGTRCYMWCYLFLAEGREFDSSYDKCFPFFCSLDHCLSEKTVSPPVHVFFWLNNRTGPVFKLCPHVDMCCAHAPQEKIYSLFKTVLFYSFSDFFSYFQVQRKQTFNYTFCTSRCNTHVLIGKTCLHPNAWRL